MQKRAYPPHIYDPIRIELAVSYLQHEFRKLFRRVPEKYWPAIDKDIADWMNSPLLNTPRDFWNGFHGICMGFKLAIGLIYFVTAENIVWKKEKISVESLNFGIEFPPTRLIKSGALSAKEVSEFYFSPKNKRIKEEQRKVIKRLSWGTPPRDKDPIIVAEKILDDNIVLSIHEGNWRLIKAILEEKKTVLVYIGRFTSQEKSPRNYWVPTSIIYELLNFAKEAFKRKDKKSFQHYMGALRDILSKSEIAAYELKERALTGKKSFREEVLKSLCLI